jgi:nitrile hydratase beta subunit
MNGVHDMGGMQGFGKVEPEADEPVFHAPWESRVLAMERAMRIIGAWNIDTSRATQERLPPVDYLGSSYYRRWALALERNAITHGLIDPDELTAGRALRPGRPVKRALSRDNAAQSFTRGSFSRPPGAPARFTPGDRVRTKNIHPASHTRLPRYARGREGQIEAVRGCHVFPDSAAGGGSENPQWLYTVVFSGRELWGADADPASTVSIEAFEPYLEPA